MKDWLYYSTLVPGYTEKYGTRDIRERNAILLSMAKKGHTEEELRPVANLLAENNQPLAMYVAHRFGREKNWTNEEIMDAFQQCCLTLTEQSLKYLMTEEINQAYYQRRIYLYMLNTLCIAERQKYTEGEKIEFIPFDEKTYPAEHEPEYHINVNLFYGLIKDRERQMLFMFYGIGCEKADLEEIAWRFSLTKERVRQIIVKTVRKLARIFEYYQSKKRISRDIFLLESWEHPWFEKKESTQEQSQNPKPQLPDIFWDTNNEKLKKR